MAKYSLRPLISLYNSHADPEKARQMRAYMKDQFNYLGLPAPLRKELTKQFYQAYDYPLPEHIEAVVLEACRLPQREFRYFALELLVKMRAKTGHDAILLYEKLITDEPWWDTIDLIAPSLVGFHFQQYPDERSQYINDWIKSGNIWLQRSCILFQLKYKSQTDTQLLSRIIIELKDSKEFFIRKAIGWALREHSKTDPEFVIRFVQSNELSGLSQREALKWLERF